MSRQQRDIWKVEDGNKDEEHEYFLPSDPLGATTTTTNNNNNKNRTNSVVRPQEAPINKSNKSCCTCKCCCITCSVIVVVIVALLVAAYFVYKSKIGGGVGSADSGQWEEALGGGQGDVLSAKDISGEYKLVSFDDKYQEYLETLGVPSFVVPIIMSSPETITIVAADEEEGVWSMTTKNDHSTKVEEFRMGEEYMTSWAKGGTVMYNVCTRPESSMLKCTAEERSKGWNFEFETRFAKNRGMVVRRHFINKGVAAKKFYQKVGGEQLADVQGEHQIPIDGKEEGKESPFSEEDKEDEEFWNKSFEDTWPTEDKDTKQKQS